MTISSLSGKRNRVYVRKFDHDEARARFAAGETVAEIARSCGVSWQAVNFVVRPAALARHQAYYEGWRKATCACGAPCQRAVFRGEEPRCVRCAADGRATSVREDELKCSRCQQWKPDDAFLSNRHRSSEIRRHRHGLCRPCQTEVRRDYRNRTKVPCVRCGEPTLSQAEKTAGSRTPTGLCAACFIDSQRRSA